MFPAVMDCLQLFRAACSELLTHAAALAVFQTYLAAKIREKCKHSSQTKSARKKRKKRRRRKKKIVL